MTAAVRDRFDGKVALVTGASRGIGLAIAQRIVEEGGRVCLTARNKPALDDAIEALGGADVAVGVAGNTADSEHQDAAVRQCLAAFGQLNILVNNAATNPVFGSVLDVDARAAHKILDVNLVAALAWVRTVHRDAFDANGGVVVNVASVAGLAPASGIGFYGTSKAALMHLTQQLAQELGDRVRVNAIAPAVVRTRFASALFEDKEAEVIERYALKRLGNPRDIGAAAAFLASDDASWITGQTLVVDGGLTLNGGL